MKDSRTVSPYLLWFLIHGSQTGAVILNFQNLIVKGAGHDAWVSLLLVGLSLHAVIGIMFYVLKHSQEGDIVSLHRQLFGKWAGGAFTLLLYGYAILFLMTEIRTYVEVIHIWVFPNTPLWELSLLILVTVFYIAAGGIRVVAGVCFWCVILPTVLLATLYFPLEYAHWGNFLPLFNHRAQEYAASAYHALPLYLGVEFVLVYYPFIQHNEKSQKWAHIGAIHTTAIYLIITVVTFAYLNVRQLEHSVWPTLILSKIIRIPFIERFDYIYIFAWFAVILTACSVALWSGTRMLRRLTGWKARPALWLTSMATFAGMYFLKEPMTMERLHSQLTGLGWGLLYGYLPALAAWVGMARLLRKG